MMSFATSRRFWLVATFMGISTCTALLTPAAQAGFSWEPQGQPAPSIVPAAPLQAEQLTESGTITTRMPVVRSTDQLVLNKSQFTQVAEGFGSDIPLAYALRQIVPPQFAFSFAPTVNAGVRVSWEGGKPWPHVMDAMLAPLGLQSRIYTNMVVIEGGNSVSEIRTHTLPPLTDIPNAPIAQSVDQTAQTSIPQNTLTPERKIMRDPGPEPLQPASDSTVQSTSIPPAFVKAEPPATPEVIASAQPVSIVPPASQRDSAPDNIQTWQAEKGQSLRQTVILWGQQANVGIDWRLPADVPLSGDVVVSGPFTQAVKTLFTQSGQSKVINLRLVSGQNAGPQSVLIIEPKTL